MALRRQKFALTNDDIDLISATALEELDSYRISKENKIKTRFSIEEALLRLQKTFGTDAEVELSAGRRSHRHIIEVRLRGRPYNPLRFGASEFEEWNKLLSYSDYKPDYRYVNGINTIRWTIPIRRRHPAIDFAIAILSGLILGYAGRGIASQVPGIIVFLEAFEEVWIRLLNVLSGPVIFLLIITTVLNMDSVSRQGGSAGRFLMKVFKIGFVSVAAVIGVSLIIYPDMSGGGLDHAANDLVFLLLQLVPKDIIQPFAEANSPQLLLLAFVLGSALVVSGSRNKGIAGLIREANNLGIMITGWMSGAAPFFIFVLLTYEIMKGNVAIYAGLWKPLLLVYIGSLLLLVGQTLHVADIEKVVPTVLFRKLLGPFRRTLTEGSTDSVYDETLRNCYARLGIEDHFAESILSVGLVLYMPLSAGATLAFTIYAASMNGVDTTVTWFLIAAVSSVAMSIAAPPIPGVGILTYVVLFSQLGIPKVALIAAMLFDIFTSLIIEAGNQYMLQLDMIMSAERMAMLDHDLLASE